MFDKIKHFYEFDEFRLDAGNPALWREGKLVSIPPKALETLILLVEKHGEIVSREELLDTVWQNTFVEESNITYTVSLLRKTLDEHDKKHFIQTIPKHGYRFVADVREVTENGLPVIEDKVRLAYRTAVPLRFVQGSNGDSNSPETNEFSNLYSADSANLNEQKQLTFGNADRHGKPTLEWLDDERIIYPNQLEGNTKSDLWLINSRDGARQQLTENKDFTATMPASDGKAIYFQSNQTRFLNIYRTDIGGENVTPITAGSDGHRQFPQVSPDGKYLYYQFRGTEKAHIKRMNLADGKEEVFFQSDDIQPVLFLTLSADGKYLAFPVWRNPGDVASIEKGYRMAVISTENPAEIKTLEVHAIMPMLRLASDGKAIEYVSDATEGTQILRQNLGGGEPQIVLFLPKEKIFNFAWSKSGTRLAISRGQSYKDAVLLTNFE